MNMSKLRVLLKTVRLSGAKELSRLTHIHTFIARNGAYFSPINTQFNYSIGNHFQSSSIRLQSLASTFAYHSHQIPTCQERRGGKPVKIDPWRFQMSIHWPVRTCSLLRRGREYIPTSPARYQ